MPAIEGMSAHRRVPSVLTWGGARGPQDPPRAQGCSTCLSTHLVHIPGGRPGAACSPSLRPRSHQLGSLPLLTHTRQGCLPQPPGCRDEVQGLWRPVRGDAASQTLGI